MRVVLDFKFRGRNDAEMFAAPAVDDDAEAADDAATSAEAARESDAAAFLVEG